MKKRIAAAVLALALTLPLGGCAAMFQRPYSSAVDHVELSRTVDTSILRAETYRGLVDAILYFVNAHAEEGVVRLYNYTGNVNEDLDAACKEVLLEDPLAAFAVEDITFQCARIVSYYEATLFLSYSHSAQEVDAIQFAAGGAALRQELGQAIADFSSSLLLRLSYFPGDGEDVRSMAVQAYYDTPQAAFGMPEFDIAVYPEGGVQRIVEVDIHWPQDPGGLAARSAQLTERAQEVLAGDSLPAGQTGRSPEQLAELLRRTAAPMDPAGSADPFAALTGGSANQLAHVLALELLLHLSGMEATLAAGRLEDGDVCWLIVNGEGGWRHLLLTDEVPRLYTDLELTALGYLWNREGYPACVDYNADLSGETIVTGDVTEPGAETTPTPDAP